MNKLILPSIIGAVGILAILAATILGFLVIPNVIDNQIEEEVRLIPGTDTYDKWLKNPFPAFMAFYMFNVTDPGALDRREKPKLQEFGPYVYEQFREKDAIAIHDEDDTISYIQRITYVFREDLSIGSAYDKIFTTVNVPFIIVAQALYEALGSFLANILINLFFVAQGESFIRTQVSIDELIFNGVPLNDNYGLLLGLLPDPPKEFGGDRFAFYRGKNGSHDGVFRIKSGKSNPQEFGRVETWNGKPNLNWWKSPDWLDNNNNNNNNNKEEADKYCNMINGTDGSLYSPFIKKSDQIRLFVTDICRSLVVQYEKEIEHRDIPGYRFTLPDSFYADPIRNDDNYCFCVSPPAGRDLNNTCGEGLIRLFPCQNGAPIIVSSPHFLNAGKEFVEIGREMGLNPIYEEHQTKVDLEPNSGVTLSIHKKLQVSMEIQNFTNVTYFSNLEHLAFPVFWANEYADMDETMASDLKSQLLTPLKIVTILKWTVLAVGIILVLASAGIFYFRVKSNTIGQK